MSVVPDSTTSQLLAFPRALRRYREEVITCNIQLTLVQ